MSLQGYPYSLGRCIWHFLRITPRESLTRISVIPLTILKHLYGADRSHLLSRAHRNGKSLRPKPQPKTQTHKVSVVAAARTSCTSLRTSTTQRTNLDYGQRAGLRDVEACGLLHVGCFRMFSEASTGHKVPPREYDGSCFQMQL